MFSLVLFDVKYFFHLFFSFFPISILPSNVYLELPVGISRLPGQFFFKNKNKIIHKKIILKNTIPDLANLVVIYDWNLLFFLNKIENLYLTRTGIFSIMIMMMMIINHMILLEGGINK